MWGVEIDLKDICEVCGVQGRGVRNTNKKVGEKETETMGWSTIERLTRNVPKVWRKKDTETERKLKTLEKETGDSG